MALGLKLEARQTQQLSMTPQLRQAIAMLQMTNTEMTAFLEDEARKNPILDVTPARRLQRSSDTGAPSDLPDIGATFAAPPNHRHDLSQQIRMSERDIFIADAACDLIDELDSAGFLRASDAELCARYDLGPAQLTQAVAALQSCEPIGIGARDLRDCLRIQLVDLRETDGLVMALIDHLDALADGDMDMLEHSLGVSSRSLKQAVTRLQCLNPRPLAVYDANAAQPIVPDVLVTQTPDGVWHVELNADALPRVLINTEYAGEVTDESSLAFLKQCHSNAGFIVKAMERRAQTIFRVAKFVVAHQQAYFVDGISALQPLNFETVAEALGVHETTVGRAILGKFVQSPQGTVSLRFLMARGISRTSGDGRIATKAVQERIRALIALETAENIYSDELIRKTLREGDVDIARRTVAKYREAMGIPPSNRRRRRLAGR